MNACNVERNTALHLAVMESKDLRQIKTLIDNGAEINKQNCHGNTALHLCLVNTERFYSVTFDPLAYQRVSERHVQPLRSHTVTVNEVTVNANLLEDYDIAETLLDKGADLNIQNNDGNTPLHLALINSKPPKLVNKSNDKMDHLDTQYPEDVKVFKLASKESNMYKLVKKMIDKGADVGKQNNEGNTALHLALSSQLQLAKAVDENMNTPHPNIVNDNFEKLLQILLGNSETIYACNKLGMDPIQMTIDIFKRQHYSLQKISWVTTIVPLLNLEYDEHFSYSDCHGNSLLHLLMESFQNRYYPFITLRSVDPTYLKFNVQNKAGNTPLHIAREKDLVYILSYCDKVVLFARNKRKETFLHTIFKFQYLYEKGLIQFLQGQCKYCSKEDVKKLLCCRDIAGNTPLHVLITNGDFTFSSDLIKSFYEAGADLNACNTNKESILHCLVRKYDNKESIKYDHEESIKFAIEHGADLNVQNVFGESPIFLTMKMEVMKYLVESGADLKICNKSGQNLLMLASFNNIPEHITGLPEQYLTKYHILKYLIQNCRPSVKVKDMHGNNILHYAAWHGMYRDDEIYIKYLIQNCSLKVKDIHGNNILHYAAWHGMYIYGQESCYGVNMLLEAGAEIEPDALGQLPCYIAHQMGQVKLARRLCKCENTEHLDKFTFTKKILDLDFYENLKSWKHNFSPLFNNKRKYFASHPITDILETPFIGSVKFEDEGEAEEIGSCIVNIINDICKRLGHGNDLLGNNVIQSGSVSENTKVGLPNEFDFLCVLDILSKACYVETVSKEPPACATVKLKDEFRGHRCRSLFDENCYFRYNTVLDIFMAALRDAVQCLDICSHPNIIYKKIFHMHKNPNVELHFVWTGRKYKGMEIKVDLVPAIQIKGWWPSETRLDSLTCDTEQIELLRKDGALILFKGIGYLLKMLPISVSTAEKMHLAGLPQEARIAYRIAKILCDKRVCPRAWFSGSTNITSYMLKNCMFHVLDNPIESVYDCVCKIFRYLIECTKKENLPSYVYPLCNIFEKKRKVDIISMRFYSQIILNMIGSTEEFLPTDFDELIEYERMYSRK